jgi:hypothetical protein
MKLSNVSLFRRLEAAENQMLLAVMPRTTDDTWEVEPEDVVQQDAPPVLRVSIAEHAGTRLFGFRRIEVTQ